MKHKFFSKRGLALVVSVMMCLSAMSTTAWAGNFAKLQEEINNAEGSYTLTENYTYGEDGQPDSCNTITIDKEITLDLGGFTINGAGTNNDSVITVGSKGDLTLKDDSTEKTGTITGGTGKSAHNGTDGGGIYVNGGGNVTMEGGKVTGNTATWGGGVMVRGDGSSFTMTGGEVSGNTASDSGGGVFARDKVTVELDGGNIDYNATTKDSGNCGGGGVYVQLGADFTMKSGSISCNTSAANTKDSTGNKGASGGGVFVENGKFTMTGGEISGNDANGIGEGGGIYGKGNSTVISMTGGKVAQNMANSTWGGGGVRVWDGASFQMTDGEISGNLAPNADADKDRISISVADNGNKAGKAEITGGTIQRNAQGYIPEGYGVVADGLKNTVKVVKHDLENPYGEHQNEVTTPATCTAGGTKTFQCSVEGCTLNHTETIPMIAHDLEDVAEVPATCTTDGTAAGQKCKNCDYHTGMETIPAAHTDVVTDEAVAPTCEGTGLTEGSHCEDCHTVITAQQATPSLGGHVWDGGVVTREATPDGDGEMTFTCTREGCGATRTAPIEYVAPDTGDDDNTGDTGDITIDDPDVPLGDEPAPAVTIADEDVPLAGLVTLAQLLDELYRHEGAPEVHIPDGFPFADHEYAEAICWGLDNALVFHTEAEPLNPDELVTVGLMREVLTNFVAYRGVEEFTVELAGADDEIVMDLGERLVVFYAQLAEAEAAAEADETEAA